MTFELFDRWFRAISRTSGSTKRHPFCASSSPPTTVFPALYKLAEIFEQSGKDQQSDRPDESMLADLRKATVQRQIDRTLERLIILSDKPFSYEEYLSPD